MQVTKVRRPLWPFSHLRSPSIESVRDDLPRSFGFERGLSRRVSDELADAPHGRPSARPARRPDLDLRAASPESMGSRKAAGHRVKKDDVLG